MPRGSYTEVDELILHINDSRQLYVLSVLNVSLPKDHHTSMVEDQVAAGLEEEVSTGSLTVSLKGTYNSDGRTSSLLNRGSSERSIAPFRLSSCI